MHPFTEQVIRHRATNEEGKVCEILERVTLERQPDGAEPKVVNRRFDLNTGERLNRLSEDEFEEDETGARLQLQR